MAKIDLIKNVKGINTYKNVVDTNFHEFITPVTTINQNPITVEDFFTYYDQLFYDIPISGDNSHYTLVERSQQYIGGTVQDPEKTALIEEINTLKQQIIELTQTYLTVGSVTQ